VIERREVTRVGANRPIAVDVRLICATNSDIYESLNNGNFRQDLLYGLIRLKFTCRPYATEVMIYNYYRIIF